MHANFSGAAWRGREKMNLELIEPIIGQSETSPQSR